jgi:ribonuclease P protein component
VVRNAVRRRLRHLMVDRVQHLPAGARVVVRALPEAAMVRSSSMAHDVDNALMGALRRTRGATR